ncbi:MAG: DedA family protein [Patescibacteria group bacterium]|nr:DedA family protein [Patescibacteria group bacterium]MCL5224432.1 DedA family protein [Patescibacteria group bacterium]
MPPELTHYITSYGYLAIFSLIFIQELGVPNPVPNEFILLFGGYLTSVGTLSLPLTFLSAVSADFIGTSILFTIFYFFGKVIIKKKPRWIPIRAEHIERMTEKIAEKDWWGIYLGRLIPYVRGYTSVAAGLLNVRPHVFEMAVALSAITWSGGYVLAGHFMGGYWGKIAQEFGGVSFAFYSLIALFLIIFFGRKLLKLVRAK